MRKLEILALLLGIATIVILAYNFSVLAGIE